MPACFGKTALLIFSRTAAREAAVKTFHRSAGRRGNQHIALRLIRQTIATAHRSGLPVFIHYDTAPGPRIFGERLADAMEAVFRQGYAQLIVLGNDCPDVSAPLLLEASRRLTEHGLVLGPATDGGVYLIGIAKTAYLRPAFVDLPWETAQLQTGWKQYRAAAATEIDWLEPFGDIDRDVDFNALVQRLPRWTLLRKRLLSILASFVEEAVAPAPHLPSQAHLRLTPLRGPPMA